MESKQVEEDPFGQIFMAWIKDTHESPTRDNFLRLQEVMDKHCNEKQFVMHSQRLGVNCALTLARLLDRSPVEKLDLYENVLRDHGIQALAPLFRDSRTLTYLNLGGNDMGPMGAMYLASILPINKKLKYLLLGSDDGDLHVNRIDDEAGKLLAEALGKNKTLKALDLNRNPLGQNTQAVFFSFATVLEKNRTLTTLKLGACGMHSVPAVALIKALNINQSMEYLDIHSNDLHPGVGDALAELINKKNEKGVQTLKELYLQNNPRLTKGMLPFFRSLKADEVLTTLNVASTGMGDEGAIVLAETLSVNETLTYLNLSDNGITEEGCIGLCLALENNYGVRFLGLSGNKLRDDGACALAATMEVNSTLEHLEISSARISDRGTVALGVSLSINSSLLSVRLNNNHISDEAGQALSELLEKNKKLLTIDVRGNQVSHATLLRVKKVVKKNQGLREGEIPNQLQQEVIRLHFQQYKLQEANGELKEHQRSRLELQDQADRAERDAAGEREACAKKSKDISEKRALVENFCEDMKIKRKNKLEDQEKFAQQFEQDLKALQEKLKQDIQSREEKEAEMNAMEKKYQQMEKAKQARLTDCQKKTTAASKDREAWLEKNALYRKQAAEAQEKIAALESQLRERQAAMAQELAAKATARPKK